MTTSDMVVYTSEKQIYSNLRRTGSGQSCCHIELCVACCRWFGLASGIFGETLGVLSLVYFYMPWLWQVSTRAVKHVGLDPRNEIYVTIAYFLIDGFKDTVLGLPWSLYSTFVIEERYSHLKGTA